MDSKLNGLIGSGVPLRLATHIWSMNLAALRHVDYAQPTCNHSNLIPNSTNVVWQSRFEQMGRNTFGLSDGDDLAERHDPRIEFSPPTISVATQLEGYGDARSSN